MPFETAPEAASTEIQTDSSSSYNPADLVDYNTGEITDPGLVTAGQKKYDEIQTNPDYANQSDKFKADLGEAQRVPAMKQEVFNRAYAGAINEQLSVEDATKFANDAAQAFAEYQFSAVGRAEQAAKNNLQQ